MKVRRLFVRRPAKLAWLLALTALAGLGTGAEAAGISGAGATFPYPIYAKWAQEYKAATGVALNYQSIGSGGGIRQIERGTVDFGASDKPLTAEELDKKGLVQFPMIVGGVLPVVNVKGIAAGQLRLDGPTLAKIYLGEIKTWNDPALRALNPGLSLPDQAISPIYRADGSGTTFIFTHYLSEASDTWKQKVGAGTAVAWPVGVGGKGNEGVTSYVSRIPGGIGYVEHVYAFENHLAHVLLKNDQGDFVAPSREAFAAAAAGADWAAAPGFYLLLTNQHGEGSWPITGASFILMHRQQAKPEVARQALAFFDWSYRKGAGMATGLDYVPIPETVVDQIETSWTSHVVDSSGTPIWQGAP
ncbi:MAG: phosphate ABC transporter substrate-binding protein PstS [Acidobacteria bacterium]|nr:phosphate ABC transporter substrate-binding protein PstS [Acidobacteriota bacterium]